MSTTTDDPIRFSVGTHYWKIKDLTSETGRKFNGKTCVIVSKFDVSTGRVGVRIETARNKGRQLNIKPINLHNAVVNTSFLVEPEVVEPEPAAIPSTCSFCDKPLDMDNYKACPCETAVYCKATQCQSDAWTDHKPEHRRLMKSIKKKIKRQKVEEERDGGGVREGETKEGGGSNSSVSSSPSSGLSESDILALVEAARNKITDKWDGGAVYYGQMEGGKPHGYGTWTWADGDKYVGGFKDGEQDGNGTYTAANGDKYVGEWKDGKRNGQGTSINNGRSITSIWVNDQSTTTKPLRFALGTRVECNTGAWTAGTVVQIHYSEAHWPKGRIVPYQIRLDDGRLIFAPMDDNRVIREGLKQTTPHEDEDEEDEEETPKEEEDKEDCPICCDALPKLDSHFTRLICCGKGVHKKCNADLETNTSMTLKQKNTCIMCRAKQVQFGSKEDIERLRGWVKKGKAWAMGFLADRYREGVGVKQSSKKFVELLEMAAKRGHARSQYNLGGSYKQGTVGCGGLTQSSKKASKYYKLAAEQGHATAQFHLGIMYANGEGIEQSYSKAREWWTKAAAQGQENAIKFLKQLDQQGK